MKHHSILCLGDSYTIGEGVALHENFPYQLIQLLRKENYHFNAPEIVAKTGWTTFELAEHLIHTKLNEQYDVVTLLIGVNNQYRGLSIADFTNDFEFLIKKALHYAKQISKNVIVLSIPDWGCTPFAQGRDKLSIEKEIDMYNAVCANIAKKYHANFINITTDYRKGAANSDHLATDQLHPSGIEYAQWATAVFEIIVHQIKRDGMMV